MTVVHSQTETFVTKACARLGIGQTICMEVSTITQQKERSTGLFKNLGPRASNYQAISSICRTWNCIRQIITPRKLEHMEDQTDPTKKIN
jgi:hypothetical protein